MDLLPQNSGKGSQHGKRTVRQNRDSESVTIHPRPVKIKINSRPAASALLVTLLTAAITAISLASYLAFVSNQNLSVARAFAWNCAIPVAEAGLEEALTQIH